MQMTRLALAIVGLAIAAGCTTSNRGDPTGPLRPGALTLDDTVSVVLGSSAVTRDGAVRVSFAQKLADSRCPIDAVCIWAGDVGAVLRIETLEQSGEGRVHTALNPKEFVLGDYQISLVDMHPYPGDKRPLPQVAAVRVLRPRGQ
jgi:hypothetical protein